MDGLVQSLSVFDDARTTPLFLVRSSALHRNGEEMRRFAEANGVLLAPHCKTHLSPELWHLQEAAGAVACTVATVAQARAMYAAGAATLIIANQVAGKGDIAALAAMVGAGASVSVFVDSVAGVELLEDGLCDVGSNLPPFPVYVEVGVAGRRAGARSAAGAVLVAEEVHRSPMLSLAGVAGYEGVLWTAPAEHRSAELAAYLDLVIETIEELFGAELLDANATVTLGGSDLYPAVVQRLRATYSADQLRVLLRSGCYFAFDHGKYADAHRAPLGGLAVPQFVPSIEIWAPVLSVPESGLAIVGLGRRDASSDERPPITLARRTADGVITRLPVLPAVGLYDQHLVLDIRDAELAVGDLVGVGVSHPCTTFDKWRTGYLIDDDYRVIDTFRTLFH
jgi:D-serine dehydratase